MRRILLLAMVASACVRGHTAPAALCQEVETGYGPPGTVAVHADTVTSGLEVPWRRISK